MKIIRTTTTISIITAVLFLLVSCEDDSAPQEIFFEYEYINFAWGYQLSGMYIDRSGDIYSYEYAYGDEQWKPKNSGRYTTSELLDKYSHQPEYVGRIEKDSLRTMQYLLLAAEDGPYSKPTGTGGDMGSSVLIGYRYNSKSDIYRHIVMDLSGDSSYRNLNPAAGEIIRMMQASFWPEHYPESFD